MSYELTTLENGLRVASESLPGVETVALAISVDVGARHETPEQHGISHLLEHMAFKGTKTRSALDIAQTFDNIGGHLNAFTSHEHTVYYAKVLKEHLTTAAEVLGDIIRHSVFDDTELEREKQVILQELAMHHDTPDDLVFDYFQETAFPEQALGRSILGTAEMIQSHPSDAIHEFVAQHYQPKRMVVTAAGNVSHKELVTLIEDHLPLKAGGVDLKPDSGHYRGGEKIVHKHLEQLQLMLGVGSMSVTDDRYYTLQLLSTILGGGMSSRLFQEVREKRGLVYTIQSFTSSYADCGLFAVYAATSEQEAPQVLSITCEQLQNVCTTITEEEFSRAKHQQKANLLMARESTANVAEWMGRHLLQFGEYRSAQMLSNRIDTITVDDVKALAKTLFTEPDVTIAALGPTEYVMPACDISAKLVA